MLAQFVELELIWQTVKATMKGAPRMTIRKASVRTDPPPRSVKEAGRASQGDGNGSEGSTKGQAGQAQVI